MCGTSAVLHTKASSPPWHCPWFRGGAHLHLRGRDLRVLLFPPRLTPASGTIGDTLNSRRTRSERRTGSKRRRNGSQNDRKRERERGGKSTAFSTGEGKEGEIFFPFLLSANNGRKVSIFPPHTHTSSLCYFPRKEKRSRQAEIISRVPLFSRSRNGERDRLAFHREKTLDQGVSRFVNRSTRCNSAWDNRGKRKSGRRRRRNGESEENGGYLLHVS